MRSSSVFGCCWKSAKSDVDGRETDWDTLSLEMRKALFDSILSHKKLDDSRCLRRLTSRRFFAGFDVIDVERRDDPGPDEPAFLLGLLENLRANQSLADGLVRLNLRFCTGTFDNVCQLIGECRNLRRLGLIGDLEDTDFDRPDFFRRLAVAVETSGLVGLQELQLKNMTFASHFRCSSGPMFNCLSVVRLHTVHVTSGFWREFLLSCRDTLSALALKKFSVDDGTFLPVLLPRLKSLRIDLTWLLRPRDQQDFQMLRDSPSLENAFVELYDSQCWSLVSSLSPLDSRLEISLWVRHEPANLGELVKTFGRRVVELRVDNCRLTDEICEAILTQIPRLTRLHLKTFETDGGGDVVERFLVRLLGQQSISSPIADLQLEIFARPNVVRRAFRRLSNPNQFRVFVDDRSIEIGKWTADVHRQSAPRVLINIVNCTTSRSIDDDRLFRFDSSRCDCRRVACSILHRLGIVEGPSTIAVDDDLDEKRVRKS